MNPARIPAGYWLLIGLAVISVGLVGTMFMPQPLQCLNDGILDIQVADTLWRVPSNDVSGITYEKWEGGKFCEPPSGIIPSDSLTIQNDISPEGLFIYVTSYRGGRRWKDTYEVFCSRDDLIDMTGRNLGRPCQASKALTGGTIATVKFSSIQWPPDRQSEVLQATDAILATRRIR